MKICVDPNGQINQRAKQKYEVLSATDKFVYGIYLELTVKFIKWLNVSIQPLDRTLTCIIGPSQSGPGRSVSEGHSKFPKVSGLEPQY